MSTIVQPGPNDRAIFETDDHHGHHDHHRGHGGDKWDRYIAEQQAAGFREAGARAERYGAETAGQFGTVVRDVKDTRFDLAGVARDGFTAVALGQCKTDDRMGDGFGKVSGEICGLGSQLGVVAKDTALGFKDLSALGYQVEGRSLLEAAKNANAVSVQNTMFANQGAVQLERVRNELTLQAEKNAAANLAAIAECCCEMKLQAKDAEIRAQDNAMKAELTARSLAAEAAKQAAECCCELKAILAGQRTADLEDRLRTAELDARFARISVSVGVPTATVQR